ncbi:hypothetical protein B0T26DRAFT_499548 [Lasiosphaeria miniovina]|uniref:Uncharacterized protein n=1 Tax=Lasiosphaeria miniovina TaxID=1954250 RepID=A0AA40DJB4_9PEZI|nr:uncharacterized protein B0T26DRAFT_499548 [Lasiosphaeria miniovina]KAK0703461.1 hypothetical protein B0T26DRAFT_499548 [Lasiosphaeria miniovina]
MLSSLITSASRGASSEACHERMMGTRPNPKYPPSGAAAGKGTSHTNVGATVGWMKGIMSSISCWVTIIGNDRVPPPQNLSIISKHLRKQTCDINKKAPSMHTTLIIIVIITITPQPASRNQHRAGHARGGMTCDGWSHGRGHCCGTQLSLTGRHSRRRLHPTLDACGAGACPGPALCHALSLSPSRSLALGREHHDRGHGHANRLPDHRPLYPCGADDASFLALLLRPGQRRALHSPAQAPSFGVLFSAVSDHTSLKSSDKLTS